MGFSTCEKSGIRVAYKYYDVALDYLSGLKKYRLCKHRGFANLAYSTNKTEKGRFWSFDTTLNLVGKTTTSEHQIESGRIPDWRLFAKLFYFECSDFQKFFRENPSLFGWRESDRLSAKSGDSDAGNPFEITLTAEWFMRRL
jgi:hypothetical protein